MVGNRESVPTRKRQCSSNAYADEVVRGTYVGTAQGQPPDSELCEAQVSDADAELAGCSAPVI